MSVELSLRDELLAALPSLRAFAISLIFDRTRADDLVQDTLVRAWGAIDRFERGTNLNAWLFTILRNLYYSEHRKRQREVADPEGSYAATLAIAPDQPSRLDYEDMRAALARIPADQREALLLVAAEGLSYEDVAQITGVAIGTVKSRVNRARVRLAALLDHTPNDDLGPDTIIKAAVQA
jgi:RNA polymerase sigma-70 factor (ECF subfamily)